MRRRVRDSTKTSGLPSSISLGRGFQSTRTSDEADLQRRYGRLDRAVELGGRYGPRDGGRRGRLALVRAGPGAAPELHELLVGEEDPAAILLEDLLEVLVRDVDRPLEIPLGRG